MTKRILEIKERLLKIANERDTLLEELIYIKDLLMWRFELQVLYKYIDYEWSDPAIVTDIKIWRGILNMPRICGMRGIFISNRLDGFIRGFDNIEVSDTDVLLDAEDEYGIVIDTISISLDKIAMPDDEYESMMRDLIRRKFEQYAKKKEREQKKADEERYNMFLKLKEEFES